VIRPHVASQEDKCVSPPYSANIISSNFHPLVYNCKEIMPVRVATNIILRINKVLRKQDSEHASHIKPRLLKKKKKKGTFYRISGNGKHKVTHCN